MFEKMTQFYLLCAQIKVYEGECLFFADDTQEYLRWAKYNNPESFKESLRYYCRMKSAYAELERSVA